EGEAGSEIIADSREGGAFAPEEVVDSPQPALETIPADRVHESTGPETAMPESGDAAENAAGSTVEETDQTPGHLTANVREQGGRYMHRLPRRLRRKMRSDPRAGHDTRTGPEARGE